MEQQPETVETVSATRVAAAAREVQLGEAALAAAFAVLAQLRREILMGLPDSSEAANTVRLAEALAHYRVCQARVDAARAVHEDYRRARQALAAALCLPVQEVTVAVPVAPATTPRRVPTLAELCALKQLQLRLLGKD